MLEGLSTSAAARGCSLMTAISGNDPAKEAESLTRLIDAGVDGLVVNTCGGNDKAIAAAAGRLPVVLLDRVTLANGGVEGVSRLDETIRGYAGKKLGLIAVNGLVFLRLTEALAQLGPSLPAGLKIATFDDYPWNHVLFGGVTTAAQDTLTIAERVVELLSEHIDIVTTTVGDAAKLAPKRIEVPGHIEHRASTSR